MPAQPVLSGLIGFVSTKVVVDNVKLESSDERNLQEMFVLLIAIMMIFIIMIIASLSSSKKR